MATYSVVLPGRPIPGQRPSLGPIVPNLASWQASYRRWFAPTTHGAMVDVTRGPMTPTTLAGTPVAPWFDGSTMGLVARSEQTGAIQRVWAMPTPCPLDGLTGVTLAYWVYILGATFMNTGFWGQGTANSCFLETGGAGASTGPFWRGGTDHRNQFTEVATVGEWQHLAWTANASTTEYYRNGVLAQSRAGGCGTITAAGAGASFDIGGLPSGSGAATSAIDAYWADFRVYPFACSPGQIWSLYDSATRWDLYAKPTRRAYFSISATLSLTPNVHAAVLTGQGTRLDFGIHMPDEL